MAAGRENLSTGQLKKGQAFASVLLVLAVFVALYGITMPPVGGDTLRYAADVVQHAHGNKSEFWAFGHLLWRPWGYVGFEWLGPWFEKHFVDTETQAVVRFFVLTNFICCVVTVITMWDLVRRLTSLRMATFIAIAFCGANCFLAHIKLGGAHLPGLCFEILTLYLLARAAESNTRALLLQAMAGVSYATAILLWFPYVITGLGMLLFLILWPLHDDSTGRFTWRKQILGGVVFIVTLGIFALAAFSAGAVASGVYGSAGVAKWIAESGNGWSQQLGIVRAVTGIPRMLYELESDNILLKRWFFHDPYNPVHLTQLAGTLFLKLILFYVGIISLGWILAREKAARPVSFVLLGSAVPLLFFAIFVFEPGSADRYLPGFPFLYIGAAIALSLATKRLFSYACVVVLFASCLVFNAVALSRGTSTRVNEVRHDKELLDQQIATQAVVFVPTLHDEFYYVPLTHPLDHSLASPKYQVVDVIETASVRVLHWRAEFASRVLQAWQSGREVWVSERVLAKRPDGTWPWVEGDDPRIRWSELPQFFEKFQVDRTIDDGKEGFVRIAKTPLNKALEELFLRADPTYKVGSLNSAVVE